MEHGGLTSEIRRWAAAITLAGLAAAVTLPTPAFAKDPKPGKELCEVTDPQLGELSGLVARDGGYVAIGDGSDGNITTVNVVGLDENCQNDQTGVVAQVEPNDPEDLAMDSDGNYWVADTGDNNAVRDTIALHKITPNGQTTTFRFTYPGDPVNCEALLLQPDGTPIFATKEVGKSTLYKPTGDLNANAPVALEEVGSITIEATETNGGPEEIHGIPLGDAPSMFVTGGAVSPDGKKAVLRTYTDAYEWKIEGKDVAKSIVDGKPTVTPLPNEPQGEAITYSTDGKKFITGSEAKLNADQTVAENPKLWSYTPAKAASGSDKKKDDDAAPETSFLDWVIETLGVSGILWVIAGIGVIGAIMVFIGLRVILRARRKRNEQSSKTSHDGDDDRPRYRDQDDGFGGGRLSESAVPGRDDDYDDDWGRRDEPRSGSVYGGRFDDEPRSGSVYGGNRDEPRSGSVYGGRDEPGTGSVYGGGRSGRGRFDDEPGTGTVYGGRR